ncbi:kelch repeat protein [Myxococcus phage Mx1]|nr:kelch repeat protein [Myxococcus phage Mx1]
MDIPPLSLGARDSDSKDILRKHLSPALQGRGWDALIEALATGDEYRKEVAATAFDQLFKSTASGRYLDQRAADDGFVRPSGIGIDDSVFRSISIKTTARKLVVQVILETLEAFYGSEATRAFTVSEAAEPYPLQDGDKLFLQVDGHKAVTVRFEGDDFALPSAATATEVAASINRAFQQVNATAFAYAYKDPSVGRSFVRIFSGSLGLSGSVRILGGRAQNVLLFPDKIHDSGTGPNTGTTWDITPGTGANLIPSGRVRFQWIGGPNPHLQDVNVDDYANIYGDVFSELNRGVFTVVEVTPSYVDVESTTGEVQAGVVQGSEADLVFFKPTLQTISSTGRIATASNGEGLDIILPATTQAVSRRPGTGAYVHDSQRIEVLSGTRTGSVVTLNTTAPHGLMEGNWFYADNLAPAVPTFTPAFEDVDPSGVTAVKVGSAAAQLQDGRVLVAGGSAGGSGVADVYIYSPETGWSVGPPMLESRAWFTLTTLNNGKVLAVGGDLNEISSGCEIYDPESNTWTALPPCLSVRYQHVAVLLDDGKVLIVGGLRSGVVENEIYDPESNTWTATTSSSNTWYSHQAAKLPNGHVLIVGYGQLICEVYNPTSDSWRECPGHPNQATAFGIQTLPNGKVLFAGGISGSSAMLSDCYAFNPATLGWEAVASMQLPRAYHSLDYLPGGQLVAIGGANTPSSAVVTVESYDPIRNKWSPTNYTLSNAQARHRSMAMMDGILVVGGDDMADNVQPPEQLRIAAAPLSGGGLNGLFRVETVTSPTEFTYQTPEHPFQTSIHGGTVSSTQGSVNVPGPFIYSVDTPAVTSVVGTLSAPLYKNSGYGFVFMSGAESFPDDEGWLCFGFGTSSEVTPVRYLGRISDEQLILDPSFVFPKDVPEGTSVTLLKQRGAWTPPNPERVGTFYLTAAAAGRVAASQIIDQLVAAGITVNKTVVYPSDVGLGNEGMPDYGSPKISDRVSVWGGDELDSEIAAARNK